MTTPCIEGCRIPHPGTTCYVCRICKQEKGPDDFYRHRVGAKAGKRQGRACRPCVNGKHLSGRDKERHRRRQAEWYARAANTDRIQELRLMRFYNLTLDAYRALLEAQSGACAICETTEPGGHGWHVDHDHACCPQSKGVCGKCIRGLLCGRCNVGIGMFGDSPAVMLKAAAYVQRNASVTTTIDIDSK